MPKRNKGSSRAMRQRKFGRTSEVGDSPYARKVKARKQMYGPGCCAHRLLKSREITL